MANVTIRVVTIDQETIQIKATTTIQIGETTTIAIGATTTTVIGAATIKLIRTRHQNSTSMRTITTLQELQQLNHGHKHREQPCGETRHVPTQAGVIGIATNNNQQLEQSFPTAIGK